MDSTYKKIRLFVHDSAKEYVSSALADMGFEGFQEENDILDAWIRTDHLTPDLQKALDGWLESQRDVCRVLEVDTVNDRNWNEEWEKTIQPMQIGPYFIHPTWSDSAFPEQAIPITIDPKMAFGTGYHETTRLMLRLIPEVVKNGTHVLDMGTGTGILAIASLKSGAEKAVGIDIDPWSYDNALENATLNGLADRLEIRIGSVEQLKPEEKFDVILANINRNILLDLGEELVFRLKSGGFLLLSGILEEDEQVISEHPSYALLKRVSGLQENDWLGLAFCR